MKDLFHEICNAIDSLHTQDNANAVVISIIERLRNAVPFSQAVLAIKNPTTNYLEIRNSFNVPDFLVRGFKRGVGKYAINKLFYKDKLIILSKEDNIDNYNDMKLDRDYGTAVALRLDLEGRPIGYFAIYFEEPLCIYAATKTLLQSTVTIFAEAMRKERLTRCINELQRIDPETGALYFDYFYECFAGEFKKCTMYNMPLTVAIIDTDNYKEIVRLYGDEVANTLYKEVTEYLRMVARGIDLIGRYGSDELIICFPNTPLEDARKTIDSFVDYIDSETFTTRGITTSMSIGIDYLKKGYVLKDLLEGAQEALYNARLQGRGLIQVKS